MIEYFRCYKYYSHKHRRIAAFARVLDNKLEIFIEECDQKDKFSKAFAKEAYENYCKSGTPAAGEKVLKPEIIVLPLEEKPKNQFLNYLSANYLKQYGIWSITKYRYLNREQLEEIWKIINQQGQ